MHTPQLHYLDLWSQHEPQECSHLCHLWRKTCDSELHYLTMDPWQLSLKYANSVTELLSYSVAELVSMAGHLPGRGFESLESLTFFSPFYFLTFLSDFDLCRLRSDCQVWSMLISEFHAPRASCSPHPPPPSHMKSAGDFLQCISLQLNRFTQVSIYWFKKLIPFNKITVITVWSPSLSWFFRIAKRDSIHIQWFSENFVHLTIDMFHSHKKSKGVLNCYWCNTCTHERRAIIL